MSLRCRPEHETQPFVNQINAVYPIAELDKTRKKVPVHLVYGERNDLLCVSHLHLL